MNITLKEAKQQADRLSARLAELGVAIKRTQALEAIAAVHNYADWNRFQAGRNNETQAPEFNPGITEFLTDLESNGIIAGESSELQTLVASGSRDWKSNLLNTLVAPKNRSTSLYAIFPKSEASLFDGMSKLLVDKYGFSATDAAIICYQICFVAPPATFIADLEKAGVEITGRDHLLAILHQHGPRWGIALTSVFRTCRKQEVYFSIASEAVANCERIFESYAHAGVPQTTSRDFLLAANIRPSA